MRGIAGLVVDGIQDNPSVAAGLCAFAVAFSLVAGNAFYGQNGGHPVPLFATRDAITTKSVPKSDAREKQSTKAKSGEIAQIPVPKARPKVAETTEASLVRQMQAGLHDLGVYSGEIDGLYGPKTREAVMRFERELGIEPTGLITADLVGQLPGKAQAEKPAPAKQRVVREETAPQITNTVAKSQEPQTLETQPASQTTVEIVDNRNAAVIARVQIGLINAGAFDLVPDGTLNEETISAIRLFQDRYGLVVDGVPGEDLLRKMEEVGKLKKS